MSEDIPWLTVYGFGAHIKSTPQKLIVLHKGIVNEYPLQKISHLLIVGGHTINSSTISALAKNGSCMSFFDSDGTPTGVIRPYCHNHDDTMRKKQSELARHRYATIVAKSIQKSRLLAIAHLQELRGASLFYEGESQFLHNSMDELDFLIRLEEIRRLSRLSSDMYYEILSRAIPADLGFRRRTPPPQCDVVNAILSFGYAMLYGSGNIAVIGAGLDPDIGMLHDGPGGLVYDLIDPFKAQMIDSVVCTIANDLHDLSDFEMTSTRCMLSDDLIRKLIRIFQKTIDKEKIDRQVENYTKSLAKSESFTMLY